MAWLGDDEGRPRVLRRPRDLAEEIRPSGTGRGGRGSSGAPEDDGPEPPPEWPAGFAASGADRDALLVLASLPSLTARVLLNLAAGGRSAGRCLDAVLRGEAGSAADIARAETIRAADVSGRLDAAGGRMVAVGDSDYPAALLDLADPPAALFMRGRPLHGHFGAWPPGDASPPDGDPHRARPAIAIVGSRTSSPSGEEFAGVLAGAMAAFGCAVVSGGALGIDAAAHRAALGVGGATVAVLGCGIDVVYPRTNRDLFERLGIEATVVSEYPPGTPPEPFRFPARNRIVAALAAAVVVVEGAAGSGSLITAEHAADLGREVFAVPGPVTSELSAAPHRLIREGAGLLRTPEDLLQDLRLTQAEPTTAAGEGEADAVEGARRLPPGGSPDEAAVLAQITGTTAPDRIAERLGVPVREVLAMLTRLEFDGRVRETGGRFERTLSKGSTEK